MKEEEYYDAMVKEHKRQNLILQVGSIAIGCIFFVDIMWKLFR